MYNIKNKNIYVLEYSEFNKIVKDVYNKDFEFAADTECSNDSEHLYSNIGKYGLTEFEKDEIKVFKQSGKYNFITQFLLEDMSEKEIIPKGDYLITVSW